MGTFGGRWRSTAVITAGALVASLCLVAAPAGAATKPTGTLTVEAPGVTVLKKGGKDFAKAKANQKVGIGDTIQTDGDLPVIDVRAVAGGMVAPVSSSEVGQ